MSEINAIMLGFGNVGQALAKFLLRKKLLIQDLVGRDLSVIAIVTQTKGNLVNLDGIDLNNALQHVNQNGKFETRFPDYSELTAFEILENMDADVVIEMTSLNITSGQPSIEYTKTALRTGKHVITVNKGPVAFAYHELHQVALKNRKKICFEGTVMDGTPIFNLAEKNLKGCRILGFRGILNSTTNFILGEMEKGYSQEKAIISAQQKGFAEADASLDLLGWDSAAKTAVLLNVWMNAVCTPQDIERSGISDVTNEQVQEVIQKDQKLKLICEGFYLNQRAVGKVEIQSLSKEDPLSEINGTSSILTIHTDLMGDISIVEHNPQLNQTVYAIFSDLLALFCVQ